MKKFIALLAVLAVLFNCAAALADTETVETVLETETFNNGQPDGWYIKGSSSYNSYKWKFAGTNAYRQAYEGKSAFVDNNYSASGQSTYLVMPEMDLTKYDKATLTFVYMLKDWGGAVDTLSVVYRVDGGAWIELEPKSDAAAWDATAWTEVEVDLTEIAGAGMKGKTVEVAFCNLNNKGYATGIDNVTVTGTITTPDTGDSTTTGMLLGAAAIAALGIIALCFFKQRSRVM